MTNMKMVFSRKCRYLKDGVVLATLLYTPESERPYTLITSAFVRTYKTRIGAERYLDINGYKEVKAV